MEDQEKKELTERDSQELRVSGEGEKPLGFEDMDMQQDIILPRLLILQGLSELVTEGKGTPGQLADSLSKEIYGKHLDFIPLFLFKTKVMFELGKGLVMYSRNGLTITTASEDIDEETGLRYSDFVGKPCEEVPFNSWKGNKPPKLSLVYNFPSIKVGREKDFPIGIALRTTSAKAARILLSLAMTSGEDMCARKYRLTPQSETNAKGTFFVASFESLGKCSDEEYGRAKGWYKLLRAKPIDVDMKGPEEESAEF